LFALAFPPFRWSKVVGLTGISRGECVIASRIGKAPTFTALDEFFLFAIDSRYMTA
jgi:hypothetical protein